jgi:hypothetical protein
MLTGTSADRIRGAARTGVECRAFFALLGFAAGLACGAPVARGADVDLTRYAVEIVKQPGITWHGNAIYLGQGLALTAAHVLAGRQESATTVLVAGRQLTGTIVKYGDFESVDLAIVKVDESLLPYNIRHLPLLTVCASDSQPGQPVVVVTAHSIVPSRIISPERFSPSIARRFRTLIADVDTTGNSGSGVFDAASGCLLGIMSRKIEQFAAYGVETQRPRLRAKYFIPASLIREFAAPWLGTRYLRR